MPRVLGGCFGIVLGKRNDAETGGRLGVSLPPGYLLSNINNPSLLYIHPIVDRILLEGYLTLFIATLNGHTET